MPIYNLIRYKGKIHQFIKQTNWKNPFYTNQMRHNLLLMRNLWDHFVIFDREWKVGTADFYQSFKVFDVIFDREWKVGTAFL